MDVNCKKSTLKQNVQNEDTFNEIKFFFNLLGCNLEEKYLKELNKNIIIDLIRRNSRLRVIRYLVAFIFFLKNLLLIFNLFL